MGKIANQYCDRVYLTDDNPRDENPKKIRLAIKKTIDKSKVFEISSRSKAIHKAILDLKTGDILVIAGKGHEQTQDYGNFVNKFSDRLEILKNIKLKNFYINKIPDYNFNTSIPNTGSISFSNFKNTSSYIDDIPALSNIYARYQAEYEYLEIVNDVVTVWKETYGRTSRNITNYKGTPRVTYFEKGTKGTTGDNRKEMMD